MYAYMPIYADHIREYIEPIVNVERFLFFESTYSGLSRYLLAYPIASKTADDVLGEIEKIRERLPRSILPAISSSALVRKLPQKTLSMLSEGRHMIPETIIKSDIKNRPRDSPAYKFIVKRLLDPVPDVDNVIRIQAALEDRKAIDKQGFSSIRKSVHNMLLTFLSGVLQRISTRKGGSKYKILTSHIRIKAIQDARAEEILPLKDRDALNRILNNTYKHIRKREEKARKYIRGSEGAAFLVFTRDSLNAAYVYEIMNDLGKEGYNVKEIIVGYDYASEDIATRVRDTIEMLGDVRAKKILIPETPGGIIKEYLEYLIKKYEKRGMRLFIDGRGGSPATFLAVLRHFEDRLVLVDR